MNPVPSSRILGLGFDLVDVSRIKDAVERNGEAFLRRIYTEKERAYCDSKRDSAPFYAVRFAAKEAVSKAFGTGIGREIGLLDIEVDHLESGAPFIRLTGRGAELAERRGVREILVSLSHTGSQAGATVILQ